MADKSVTGLTAAGPITGSELVNVIQNGNSRKVDLAAIIAPLAPTGMDGEDGRTVLNGTAVPDSGLGLDGDFYIRTTNFVIYGPKTAGAWGSGTSLVGAPGADGADGSDGLDGVDGTSLLNGSGPPDDALDGNDGDMYLDYDVYDIYGPKTAGAWGSPTSLLGTLGSDGNSVLNGTGVPSGGLGANGDFYIDTATYEIYGPKTGGAWGSGTSLIGPPGTDGNDGLDGIDGVDGNTIRSGAGAPSGGLGVDGDFYINTSNYELYGPKTAGVWGSPVSLGMPTFTESIIVAASDESTALTVGTGKVTIRMPYAFTLTAVRASLKTAQASGSTFTVDINEGGTSVLSTKLTIDNTEKTSVTAATAAVISDASLADDSEITVDIDQVGDGTATGLKVTLIGVKT